jgi:Peptidase propeptide and YPEB domain
MDEHVLSFISGVVGRLRRMTGGQKLVIAGAAAVVLAAGGVGIAQAVSGDSEEQVTGPQADRARQAAVEAVGGGRASEVERGDDGEAAWEVEVVRPDGREVEVTLNAGLKQVGTGTEDDGGESDNENDAGDED